MLILENCFVIVIFTPAFTPVMKRSIIAFTLLLLFVFQLPPSSALNYYGVTDVTITPIQPVPQSNITVQLGFSDTTNVRSVRITYCRIDPDYLCYFPSYLMSNSTMNPNNFSVIFQLKEEDLSGYIIGLRVLVIYQNSSRIDFPTENSPDFGLDVLEPEPGIFYFAITLTDQTTTQTSVSQTSALQTTSDKTPLLFLPLIFAIPLLRRRR